MKAMEVVMACIGVAVVLQMRREHNARVVKAEDVARVKKQMERLMPYSVD